MKTIEQVRDEIAGMLHWELVTADAVNGDDRDGWGGNWSAACIGKWKNTKEPRWPAVDHPIPTTLDGIAALWPKGWRLDYLRERVHKPNPWFASATSQHWADKAAEGETELEARTRLLHAVLTALAAVKGEGKDFDDGPPCPICGSKSHGYTGHTPNHD